MTGLVLGAALFAAVIAGVILQDSISRKRRIHRIAAGTLESLKKVYVDRHEYRQVDPNAFPNLDLQFYDKAAATLESKGFSRVGDIENITLSGVYPDARTFSRILVAKNGTIVSDVYHIRPTGQSARCKARSMKLVGFTTEFTNGCSAVTSNGTQRMLTHPEQVLTVHLPAGISISRALKIHEKRIQRYREQNPGIETLTFRSLKDVLASSDRLMSLEAAYRRSIGGGHLKEEMERICAGDPDDLYDLSEMGERVFQEMQRIQEAKRNKKEAD
ncbi:MAG: hypothetical protein ACYTEL_11105 [Planctomycetota bacterium]|jgi:hypothetical protein